MMGDAELPFNESEEFGWLYSYLYFHSNGIRFGLLKNFVRMVLMTGLCSEIFCSNGSHSKTIVITHLVDYKSYHKGIKFIYSV